MCCALVQVQPFVEAFIKYMLKHGSSVQKKVYANLDYAKVNAQGGNMFNL